MSLLKRVLLKPLTIPGFAEALATLTRSRATIFMLHRFSVPDLGVSGHDSNALRRALAHLRKQRYCLISLRDLFKKLRDGEPLKRAVAFTIDDGYFEHAHVAAPLFAEFDCPVTTFVATDFIAGKTWYWFDRLRFIVDGTRRASLRAHLGDEEIVYAMDSLQARAAAREDLVSRCKDATEQDRVDCVRQLSRDAGVEVPAAPPPPFAPLSWDDARNAEKLGMTFGPHTVTHPVLSTTSDAQSEFEIAESWRRLSAEVSRPDPIFCYPNGRPKDFGEREIATIRGLGLWGAVQGHNGDMIRPTAFRTSGVVRFRVPRFAYDGSLTSMMQCLSGAETVRARIRGRVRK
jgi:peptidoglycan/xylan/chitin deacetylase (PgdA/CDA1 family)